LGSLTDSKNLALSKAGNVLSAHVLRMHLHQMKRTASVSVKSHQVLLQSLIISKSLRPYKNVLFTGCLWFTYFPDGNFCALFQDCVILSQESCDGKEKPFMTELFKNLKILTVGCVSGEKAC